MALAPIALAVFVRSHRSSDTKDANELTTAMEQGGLAAVRNVETSSELGDKFKSIAAEMESSQQAYNAVTAKYDINELTLDKALGSTASIEKGLKGVSELEKAAATHHEQMSRVAQHMGEMAEIPENQGMVSRVRTTNDALFKDQKAIYDAARTFLNFAKAQGPTFDSKHETLRWPTGAKKRALDLETEFEARAMFYDQEAQNARMRTGDAKPDEP